MHKLTELTKHTNHSVMHTKFLHAQLCVILYCILLSSFTIPAFGEDKDYSDKMSLGIELGTWSPNNLRESEATFSLKFSKKHRYSGLILNIPFKKNWSFRFSVGYYNYINKNLSSEQNSIVLIPILIDIKYALISDLRISPYVSYGVGTCIGHQDYSEITSLKFNKENIGYGINLGTGFDFSISKHWAAGIEFRYHYLKFSKVLIFTDDYSGPKINLTLYYFF